MAVQRTAPDAEVLMPQEDAVLGAVAEADVFFGHHTHDIIRGAGKLKWIQSTSAGMDALLFPEIVDSEMIVTNASGVHAIQVADLVAGIRRRAIEGDSSLHQVDAELATIRALPADSKLTTHAGRPYTNRITLF